MKKDYDIALRGHHLKILYNFHFMGHKNMIWNIAFREYNKKHANNIVEVLQKIVASNIKVKIVDIIDDFCETCKKKTRRECREFIPYGESAATADRGTIWFYGFKVDKVYHSKYILRRLREKGQIP